LPAVPRLAGTRRQVKQALQASFGDLFFGFLAAILNIFSPEKQVVKFIFLFPCT
jgi:hypothetical protein